MAIKFGLSNTAYPTPKFVSTIINVVSAIAGAIVAWLQTVDFIADNTVKIVSGICGLIIMVSLAIKPFFGQTDTQITNENINKN